MNEDPPVMFGQPLTVDTLNDIANPLRFGSDNRAGVDGTLHRFSRLLSKNGDLVGLTIRIARVVQGVADLLTDVLSSGESLLILGVPGRGKTTMIRDIARYLSVTLKRRTVIVDTSCEIGGDGNVSHPAVGCARRFQVRDRKDQYNNMLEVVKNHNPQSLVIDELGDARECSSSKAIAQRGVQLIATAHGSLAGLLGNPDLVGLVGGTQAVIIGDSAQKTLQRDRKTQIERAGKPTFTIIIELLGRYEWIIHRRVADTVDNMLAGRKSLVEKRWLNEQTNHLMGMFEYSDCRYSE
ncbi:hypothetical protein M427DRAFT_138648 [Gonapodya prolifera JEL478]|uniref:AAA+ ATPase domain-containing protein n=1 Tax=Gonapodya prolifera (strain JEL478) TaxID=1344416 RepID=A0A139A2V5_GONPJ|nr:hypothetical protein M427DRAFT_138648 [Gonapodya prolifera JEL478]|eukprot:KXS11117.1 hypothetical protein M427DRAFT_138648 [Gonapodya prolifera JEL478]